MKKISDEVKVNGRLIGEIDALYHDAALKFGLNDTELKILYTLCIFGDESPLTEIRRLTALAKQTINSGIRKLESQNLIELSQSTPKTKNVRLTEAGKILANQTVTKLLEIETEIFESWKVNDVKKYLELTERFANELKLKMQEIES